MLVYSPYGNLFDVQTPVTHDPIRFIGARYDNAMGLYHLGNGYREYNAKLMRFMQYDSASPFGAGGLNPYAYCSGNPVTFSDPSGAFSLAAKVGVGIALGLLAFLTLGFGVFAAVAAGVGAFSIGMVTAGAMMATGSVLSGASAGLHESDPDTSDQLFTAGVLIGGLGSLGVPGLAGRVSACESRLAPAVARISKGRVIRANTGIVHTFGGAGLKISNPIRFEGVRGPIVRTHGNARGLAKPVPRLGDAARTNTSGTQFMDEVVSPDEFFTFLRTSETTRTFFQQNEGPLFFIFCGGTRTGALNHAQAMANAMGRTIYSFPSHKTMFEFSGAYHRGRLTAFGSPGFPRIQRFDPAAATRTVG